MSSENQQNDFNRDRAELFEALGHPTRIRTLQVLSDSPLGFSELKKEVGIESNGLLSFHLGKLDGLVKTSPEGNYLLTDEGKEALRIVAAKEAIKPEAKNRRSISTLKVVTIVLAIALVFAISLGYYSNQLLNSNFNKLNQSYYSLNSNYSDLSQKYTGLSSTYFSIFNYSASNSFSPPISRLQAITKFLEFLRENNETLPYGYIVQADLANVNITLNNGVMSLDASKVTTPVSNYSAVTVGNTTYYYAWYVNIPINVTSGYACFIDASTGEFIPPGSL